MTRFSMCRYPLLLLLSGILVATSVQAEPIKLTVLLPFRGIYKTPAEGVKRGFLLGLQEEAAARQVDLNAWVTFEFLDSRIDKERSLQLAKDAIAGGSQAILGVYSSGVGLAIRDYVLEEAHVPLIVFGGSVSEKLRTPNPLFLRLTYSTPLMSTALARWVEENPVAPGKKPRWACIHADYVWGVGMCDGFKRAYAHVGEEIGRVPVPFKTLNKKKEIVQLAKLKPDFAVAAFTGAEAEVFFKDYYRFKVHEKIPLGVST